MNKNHRSIWNSKTNSWVAVSEKTTAKGKKSSNTKKTNFKLSQLLGTTAFLATSWLTQNAYADPTICYASPYSDTETVGTTGNDVSYCASGDLNGWNGQGGNDRLGLRNVLFNSAPTGVLNVSGTFNMGSGDDELGIWSYDAANTLNINPSTVFNTLGGDDLVTLYTIGTGELTVKGLYNLGAGNDTLRADGKVSISGPINGGDGNDSFYLGNNADNSPYHSGPERPVINSDISGDAGNDLFSLENGVTVSGTLDGGADSDTFRLDNGTARKINGGTGVDWFTLRGTFDFSNSGLILDGGADEDNLSFHDITGSIIAENMRNFETFNVGGFSKLNFTGNQLTIQNSTDPNSYNTIGIDEGSELSFSSNSFTIAGGKGLSNRGVLNLRGSAPGKILTINADYEGGLNSTILLNAKLGNDSTPIDKLIVKGNTSGKSKIFINNVDGTGGVTTNGISVVQVLGNSNAVFTLGAPVEVGNFEYFLFKSGKNWFLESFDSSDPDNCVGCEPTPTPTPSPSPTPTPTPSPSPQIYRPAVSGYVLAAPAQFDQTASLIGTYEQRQANPAINSDIWGRARTLQTSLNTNTFGYDHNSHNIQFGKIINSKAVGQEFNSQTGLTAVIGQQSADYFDEKRQFTPTGKSTGQSSTNSYSLGAYYTQTQQDKPYLDLQAYVSSHNTQFNDVNGGKAKQNGLGLAISAEIGKTYALSTSGLEITPQAQFIFQTTTYDGFTDSVSSVSKQTAESLRVRTGVTLQSNKAKDSSSKTNWNASLNLWQEVIDTPNRVISGYVVSPEKNQKPWVELGIGVNQQLSEASSLSAQISHQNSLSGNQRTANSINLSYRFKW